MADIGRSCVRQAPQHASLQSAVATPRHICRSALVYGGDESGHRLLRSLASLTSGTCNGTTSTAGSGKAFGFSHGVYLCAPSRILIAGVRREISVGRSRDVSVRPLFGFVV